jgi:hypothetical protein
MTYSPPASVTIPGGIALELVALLDAYADIGADFRLDGESDPFYCVQNRAWRTLVDALGYDSEEDLDAHPWWNAMRARSLALEEAIRSHLDGPALGAIAVTKMGHDIAEVKARLEYVHA